MTKQTYQFDLDSFIPYRMAVATRRMSLSLAKTYRQQYGLSIPEWRVLAHLADADSVSVREIHDRVDMDKPKVSRAATKLEQNGYIEKKTNSSDRRLIVMQLTPKGHALMEELVPLANSFNDQIRHQLGDDAERFMQALETIINSTDTQDDRA